MTARHAVELGIELARFEFGLRLDLLPAFPPARVRSREDILGGGFCLPEFLILRLAFAAYRLTFFLVCAACSSLSSVNSPASSPSPISCRFSSTADSTALRSAWASLKGPRLRRCGIVRRMASGDITIVDGFAPFESGMGARRFQDDQVSAMPVYAQIAGDAGDDAQVLRRMVTSSMISRAAAIRSESCDIDRVPFVLEVERTVFVGDMALEDFDAIGGVFDAGHID